MKKFILLTSLLLLAFAIYPQTFEETQKIYAGDGNNNGFFGTSVSMSSSYLISGNGKFNYYPAEGAAYVFYKNNGLWMQLAKLTCPDPGNTWSFGTSVSTDGNNFVVGVPEKNAPDRSSTGNAYVFTLENGGFQSVSLLPDNYPSNQYFGKSVTIKGNYIMVGAPGDFYSSNCSMFFYKNNNGTWELTQEKIMPAHSYYGTSTAMSDQYAVVGSPGNNSVYIYNFEDDTLTNEYVLEYNTPSDEFGNSVSITDDYLAIGSWKSDENGTDAGSVYIFNQYNGFWVLQKTIIPDDISDGALFGSSVSFSGDYLAVGASGDEIDGINSGSIYIYHNTGTDWELVKKMTASDPEADAKYGCSVSMLDGEIVVGAKNASGLTDASGAAYIVANDNSGVENTLDLWGVVLYPNPTKENVLLKGDDLKDASVTIYNTMGLKMIEMKSISTSEVVLPTKYFAEGVYFVKIQKGTQQKVVKLSKQR